jgi:TnpA family transposase
MISVLSRIKYERIYLPDKDMSDQFPHLAGVLTRPLRWDLVEQQYDEMIKSAVGLKDGTASADAILKRFSQGRGWIAEEGLIEAVVGRKRPR